MKIVVGINTLTHIEQPVYSNHCQFWYRLGKHFPDWEFILHCPRRTSIDNMRNTTAKVAIEQNADYIFFIDDDVLIPFDALTYLLACNADVAAGWTIIRGYPFENMFFRHPDGNKSHLEKYPDPVPEGIVHVDAVGFSCALLKVSSLALVPKPYFVTGPYNTEDIYYCMKLRQINPDATIVVDTRVKTSHILGPEMIDPLNKRLYKKYQEEMFPELLTPPEEKPESKVDLEDDQMHELSYENVLAQDVFDPSRK